MMVQLITILVAVVLIAGILWWFFGQHQQEVSNATVANNTQSAEVVVKGGYSPETVVLKKGVPAKLRFNMQDHTACLSHVVFDQLGVNKDLTKHQVTTVDIPTDQAGEYNFACGMDMFHGKVVVK